MHIKDEEGKQHHAKQREDTQLMTFDHVPHSNLDNHGTSQSPPSDMMRVNLDGTNQMMLSFDMRNPIDLSIDPTRQSNAMMQDPQLSPTNARLTKINRDGTNMGGDYS